MRGEFGPLECPVLEHGKHVESESRQGAEESELLLAALRHSAEPHRIASSDPLPA